MKKIYFLILVFILASCQNEELLEQVDENTSLSSQSELSSLISRINQNPTAFDDFIDESNSLSIEYPFEVTINSNTTFSIKESVDYQPLINNLTSTSANNSIALNYPVTVTLPNYESLTLQNQSELQALKASVEGSSEIDCLNFNFPIDINIFDKENSFSTRRTIQNKAQFYNLIQNLEQTAGFYEIIYPITVSIEDDSQSISSNMDLNAAIQDLDEDCFNPSLLTNNASKLDRFITFITYGDFIISSYTDEGDNQTNLYQSFSFTFNSNHTITILNTVTGVNFSGTWQAEIDDDQLVFDLEFGVNDLLDELDEDWVVEKFANPDQIELLDDDTITEEEKTLIFEKK